MSDPQTNNIGLLVPARGSNAGQWDVPLNGNSAALDGFLGGVQAISVSNANVTLTAPAGSVTPTGGPTQAQNAVLRFTGAETMHQAIIEPVDRSPAAERMRLHRERKKSGMRCIMIELRETEIDALIRKGFLNADTRNETSAIIDAIYAYFDRELT